ncbi:MAG: Gfo/Idh/MocA family oxidoreductase [Actinomycetia bacterium]|nr:Gfo/Idh/MocA family oxidoreductase [Actinomycetes bacterium]
MKTFALVGTAGYVAVKHLKAIKEVGGELILAYDPVDSVGILDSYFPECRSFCDWHKFHNAIRQIPIDYFVICSPNHMHMFHIEYGLSVAKNVICEKPLVLTDPEMKYITDLIQDNYRDKGLYPILQLRDMLPKVYAGPERVKVNVIYNTPRGAWYKESWKSDPLASGGLLMNIGIHLFDFLLWRYGQVEDYNLLYYNPCRAAGCLKLRYAYVKWELSIDLDKDARRMFFENDERIQLSGRFKEMHTEVYKNILAGRGHDFRKCKSAIQLVNKLNEVAGIRLWEERG